MPQQCEQRIASKYGACVGPCGCLRLLICTSRCAGTPTYDPYGHVPTRKQQFLPKRHNHCCCCIHPYIRTSATWPSHRHLPTIIHNTAQRRHIRLCSALSHQLAAVSQQHHSKHKDSRFAAHRIGSLQPPAAVFSCCYCCLQKALETPQQQGTQTAHMVTRSCNQASLSL